MAYKVKYRLDYCNKEKLNARLDFEIKDYSSTTIHNIVGTQDAFSYKVRNEKPDRSGYFRTLEADINIFEDENFNIDNLLTSDETKIRVKFYIEGQLEFVGFIIPDFFEVSIDKPRVISMVASDRIGTLKNQTLPRETGVQSFRYMIEQSLFKTGLDLPLNSTINFNVTGQTGDFLTKTGGLMERLSSDKGASISCYDIIKSILIVSNSFLLQENGQWHILNKLEYESRPKTKDIEQINVGGRRLINPPSSKVGVMAEFGGGLKYPSKYNFDSLDGWTEYNGFIASLNDKIIIGYNNGVPIYGGTSTRKNLVNKNLINITITNPKRLESNAIKVFSPNPRLARVKFEAGVTITQGSATIFHVYAKRGSEYKSLTKDGFEDTTLNKLYENAITVVGEGETYNPNVAVDASISVEGELRDEVNSVETWEIFVSVLGNLNANITSFVNNVSIEFLSQSDQKGNLFKIEQGVNFTKESEIDTTIFGDFINKGVNGYFYNYQRDEQSSIFYKIGSNWEQFGLGWQDQTQTPLTADRLLLHSVRQRAIMLSDAHNIITAVIKGKFSPLDIYDVCGVKYVLVEANYNFYRNETELRIEEVKYDNSVLKTDFIYSYFGGEDTTSISGVSGVSSGGVSSGGGSPCLIKIDDDGNYYVEENFYSLKDVSAFGKDNIGDGTGSGASSLGQLDDVLLSTLGDNQILRYSSSDGFWKNTNLDLSDYATKTFVASSISDIDLSINWIDIIGKPTTFTPSTHSHSISNVTNLQAELTSKVDKVSGKSLISDSEITRLSTVVNQDLTDYATKSFVNTQISGIDLSVNWTDVIGKPTTFSPSAHSHSISDVTNLQTTLNSKVSTTYVDAELTNKVDKVSGKSLILDTEITRLSSVTNQTKVSLDLDKVTNDKQATKSEFDNFVALRNNPHQVTKAQVGLTNVTNVLQASKSEFDARVVVVNNHINDKTNPHAVTKKQVGLEFATNESKATMFTDPTFTGTTKVTILELSTNWKFVKVGNNIELQYNGVTKQEMTSDGHIISHGDVTALLDN